MKPSIGKLRPSVRLMAGLFLFGMACIYWRSVALTVLFCGWMAIFFFPMAIQLVASACLLKKFKALAGVLLAGAIIAIAIYICAPWERPHFGNDVGGSFAGAEFQFKKAQLVGWLSVAISLPLGLSAQWLAMRSGPTRSGAVA